jgi:transcription initiation factor TFIID subunit 2
MSQFRLIHQKIVLSIDLFRKRISGFVELKLTPNSKMSLITLLSVNCREMEIHAVYINERPAKFTLKNFQSCLVSNGKTNEESYRTFYVAASKASAAGELSIFCDSADSSGDTHIPILPGPENSGIVVRIEYSVQNPKAGMYFVLPTEELPYRSAHMYTHNGTNDARFWFPCIDTHTERPTWEMEYTVSAEEKNLVVVSTGEESRPCEYSEDGKIKTFFFEEKCPTPARSVLVAVGNFERMENTFEDGVSFMHYCLPGRMAILKHSVEFLNMTYQYYTQYLSLPLPYKTYKQVFVEDAYSKMCAGASISILSTHLLHGSGVIDQTFKTRRLLSLALAQQWFGVYVGFKTWSDIWITFGFAGFLAFCLSQKMFGNNECRFRLLRDMEYVCYSPLNQPLYCTNYTAPSELYHKLFYKKSLLVMYLVERRIGTDGLKRVASNLLSPPSKSSKALSDHLILSSNNFFKKIKKLTGFSMKEFAERWVYSVGSPHFLAGFWFDRIKNHTEIAIRQDTTFGRSKTTSGSLIVRIVELDQDLRHRYGEHAMDIEEELHSFPCHTRPRRVRANNAANNNNTSTAPPPDRDDDDDSDGPDQIMDMNMMPGNDNTADSSTTTTVVWSPIQWIRFDPHLDWLMTISFKQPMFMWENQLRHDKDVGAQSEAIKALMKYPTKETINVLSWVLSQPQFFYRIRMEAALALAILSSTENEYGGFDFLYDFFKTNFFYTDIAQVKPNDFDNFATYFQQKVIVFSLALVRGSDGKVPAGVSKFLLHLLKNNDNSHNFWEDNYYLSAILLSLATIDGSSFKRHVVPTPATPNSMHPNTPTQGQYNYQLAPGTPAIINSNGTPTLLAIAPTHAILTSGGAMDFSAVRQYPYSHPYLQQMPPGSMDILYRNQYNQAAYMAAFSVPGAVRQYYSVPTPSAAVAVPPLIPPARNERQVEIPYGKLENQLLRYLNMDKMMPCYRNTITCACLTSLCHLQRIGKLKKNLDLFKEYTNYGNYDDVRVTAVRALVALGIHSKEKDSNQTDTSTSNSTPTPSDDLPQHTLLYLLNLLHKDPYSWFKFKILDILMDPRDILTCSSNAWESDPDPIINAVLTMISLETIAPGRLTTTTKGNTRTVNAIDLILEPRLINNVGNIILQNRFAAFLTDDVKNMNLRNLVWEMLNSDVTSSDSRLRLLLVKMYTAIGGSKDVDFKLQPRPKRPTRPTLKEKKKKPDKIKAEQEKNNNAPPVPAPVSNPKRSKKRKREDSTTV